MSPDFLVGVSPGRSKLLKKLLFSPLFTSMHWYLLEKMQVRQIFFVLFCELSNINHRKT